MNILKSQRGAMFGLDARIAAAIFAGLAIVAGAAITTTVQTAKVASIRDEAEKTKQAVVSLMYDLRGPIHTVTDSATTRVYATLLTKSYMTDKQERWLGPYLSGDRAAHHSYGQRRLYRGSEINPTASCTSNCMVWFGLDSIGSEDLALAVNNEYDGEDELTPANEGEVQWDVVADDVRLYIRMNREP